MLYSLLLFLSIGIIAGTFSGLLGIGGGIVVVPLLAMVFTWLQFPPSLIMPFAIATSLATMIVTTLTSTLAHHHQGAVIWPIYRTLAPGIALGVIGGTLLVHYLPTSILSMIFGLFILSMSFYLWFYRQMTPERTLPTWLPRFGISLLIGAKSGLLGIGGGVLTVPFLTYCNVKLRDIIGISAACSLTIAIVGTISFTATGHIYWPAALCIAITSPWFAMLGTKLSYRLPISLLRKIFSLFLAIVGIHMIWSAF